ncbi:MAG: threonine synthase [Candidatus Riflebacteria bacterium]|nr:threonine synthase [Candidatus Riflebacteria bacterium]
MDRRVTRPGNASDLRCVLCGKRSPIEDALYVCPACGGNVMVEYDLDALRRTWQRKELEACKDFTIWRYGPILPVEGRLDGPPVGWTPLIDAPKLRASLGLKRLQLKDDGRNPSASFKDRASSVALVRAKELGHELVTGASTGNAASATAVLAAALGIRTRIFVPKTAPRAKIAQLLTFGAEVLAVDGNYDQAFDLCLAATRKFGWYNRNTGFNPYTREGKKTVSFELLEQLDWKVPDLVVVPVGDGNIISGVWKGFEEFKRLGFVDQTPRLLAAQAEGSAAIVNAVAGDGKIRPVDGNTVADSISVSLPRDGDAAVQAIRASGGFGITVSDDAILSAIGEVARGSGVFGEPAAVTAYAGLKAAVNKGLVNPDWHVVILLTGNGLKDVASAMKVAGEPKLISPDPAQLDKLFPAG